MDELKKRLNKYFNLTSDALELVKKAKKFDEEKSKTIIEMASNYLNDAKHFEEKGDLLLAYGALNYAHGWLDCGAMLKFYEVDDDQMFTVDLK